MNASEKRTNDILDSLEGIQRAVPSDVVFDRFSQSLKSGKIIKLVPDRKQLIGIAASLLILAGINFSICYRYEKNNSNTSNRSSFSSEYFNYLHTIEF